MRDSLTPLRCLGLLLAACLLACGSARRERALAVPPVEGATTAQALSGAEETVEVLLPSSDLGKDDVRGVPEEQRLYRNLDDGEDADDSRSYITLRDGHDDGQLTLGFPGGKKGTVREVEVHYRAERHDAQGRIWVELYDGARMLGQGPAHSLTGGWTDYKERFTGLSVTRASDLSVRVHLKGTSKRGGLRVTSLRLRVKREAPRPVVRHVDVFLLRDISTCVIGNRCDGDACLALSDSAGTARVRFADDLAFRAVPPGDPAIAQAPVSQCLRLRLTDAEVAAQRAGLERFREDVARWTGGALPLELRIHEPGPVELGLARWGGGLWIAPWDLRPVALARVSRETDFILVTQAVRDPDLDLRHAVEGCGGALGADWGVGGAGHGWVPESGGCAGRGSFTRAWLRQLHFAVHRLSGFDDLYDGSYPACGGHSKETRRWFPAADACQVDPDFPRCGQADCDAAFSEHLLRAHWPPEGMRKLVTNRCANGIQDYDETGVDAGPSCPGTDSPPPPPPLPERPAPLPVRPGEKRPAGSLSRTPSREQSRPETLPVIPHG